MALLRTLGQGQGYFKGGLFGFSGSGKTYTAVLLAIAIRRHFQLQGPLVMFDTEGGAEYIAPLVKRLTDAELVGVRSRSLDDLLEAVKETQALQGAVFLLDSATHVWDEVKTSYMEQLNASLVARGLAPRKRMTVDDIGQIKGIWNRWPNTYLNAPLHVIVCGRAGYEWEHELNEETGKKELQRAGVKMKVEGEFAFEPSLLVEMEREQDKGPDGAWRLFRSATVLKDRFARIDGHTAKFDQEDAAAALEQVWEFFAPHVSLLTAGVHAPIETRTPTDTGAGVDGDAGWVREKRQRTIYAEEIQAEIRAAYPGETASEKLTRSNLLWEVFRTRSWTAISETLDSERLRHGLGAIRAKLVGHPPDDAPAAESVAEPVPALAATGETGEQGDLVPALQASVEQARARKGRNDK